MTLSTAQRMKLGDLLAALRPDWNIETWHRASIDEPLQQLAADPRPAADLCIRAILNAGNAANRTPKSLLDQPTTAPSVVAASLPLSGRVVHPICEKCSYQGPPRNDGECVGCWQDRAEAKRRDYGPLNVNTSRGPGPEARALLDELRAAHIERARAQK